MRKVSVFEGGQETLSVRAGRHQSHLYGVRTTPAMLINSLYNPQKWYLSP